MLTENVFDYFKHLGFDLVDRNDIDEAVMVSPEFTECCRTALAMRKPSALCAKTNPEAA